MSTKSMPWSSSDEAPFSQFCDGGDGGCSGNDGPGGSPCDGDCNGGSSK